jgi:hypothetical protein
VSSPNAEFGAVSLLVLCVTQAIAEPEAEVVQPAGSAGAVTPSKFSPAPHVAGPAQRSFAVHALPSSHAFVLFACTHCPVAGLQESSVQTLLSLQTIGVPEHEPPEQTSPVVHSRPSLQVAVLFV